MKRCKVDEEDRQRISTEPKRGVKIGDKIMFDLESIFLRFLVVGQQREMELLPLMDEYGCLYYFTSLE